ncbi:MAG: DUF4382 domain-containing protein [bacterium]
MKRFKLFLLLAAVTAAAMAAGCSGGGSDEEASAQQGTAGLVTTTLSDPPTCKGPGGVGESTFNHVWVTVTLVRAHISDEADQGDGGWVTLVDLRDQPKQIDLLSASDTQCVLTVLGSTTGLAPGDYQQIRLHLLENDPAPGLAVPQPNACAQASGGGFNCAETTAGELKTLELSSQDKTGIKIPPGRIAGGPIRLEAGKSADINIDFNACRSIVSQGNGKLRLKPTLSAGEVSVQSSISGRVVVRGTASPLPAPATIVVYAEQLGADGVDRVVAEKFADPEDGSFIFCPLAAGTYDLVVAAIDGNGVTYNATVTFGVPVGTDVGSIPLEPEIGDSQAPAAIQGRVTSQSASGPAPIDLSISPLQDASGPGGTDVAVTIPLFGASTGTISTVADPACPAGTACADYVLEVPASNPLAGNYLASGTVYAGPALGPVPYSVDAVAFNGTEPNCSPQNLTTHQIEGGGALEVAAGASVTAETLVFMNCTEVVQP